VLHLFYLIGVRNRVSTLLNLSWRYLAWGHGGGVIVGDEPSEPLPSETSSDSGSGSPKGAPSSRTSQSARTGKPDSDTA
jgi:hypothetical protein